MHEHLVYLSWGAMEKRCYKRVPCFQKIWEFINTWSPTRIESEIHSHLIKAQFIWVFGRDIEMHRGIHRRIIH